MAGGANQKGIRFSPDPSNPSNKGMHRSAAGEFLMVPSVLRAAPGDTKRLEDS